MACIRHNIAYRSIYRAFVPGQASVDCLYTMICAMGLKRDWLEFNKDCEDLEDILSYSDDFRNFWKRLVPKASTRYHEKLWYFLVMRGSWEIKSELLTTHFCEMFTNYNTRSALLMVPMLRRSKDGKLLHKFLRFNPFTVFYNITKWFSMPKRWARAEEEVDALLSLLPDIKPEVPKNGRACIETMKYVLRLSGNAQDVTHAVQLMLVDNFDDLCDERLRTLLGYIHKCYDFIKTKVFDYLQVRAFAFEKFDAFYRTFEARFGKGCYPSLN